MNEMEYTKKITDGDPPWFNAQSIFATPSRVITVCGTGGGIEFGQGEFAAIGSGSAEACGAAYALNADRSWPVDKLLLASMEAACALDNGCGPPSALAPAGANRNSASSS
jgi:ATP-dependent protease HslVU (ClpYQ) peptidase subunit